MRPRSLCSYRPSFRNVVTSCLSRLRQLCFTVHTILSHVLISWEVACCYFGWMITQIQSAITSSSASECCGQPFLSENPVVHGLRPLWVARQTHAKRNSLSCPGKEGSLWWFFLCVSLSKSVLLYAVVCHLAQCFFFMDPTLVDCFHASVSTFFSTACTAGNIFYL